MPSNDDGHKRLLDRRAAEQLLRDAAQLDAERRDSLSIAELRRAAVEAGISAESFDDALAKSSTTALASAVIEVPRRRPWLLSPTMVGTGYALGALAVVINETAARLRQSDAGALVPIAAAVVASIGLAMWHRRGARLRQFGIDHVLLWSSVLVGVWSTETPRWNVIDDATAVFGGVALVAAVIGALVVSTRFAAERRAVSTSDYPTDPSSGSGGGRRRGVAFRRMIEWLRRITFYEILVVR